MWKLLYQIASPKSFYHWSGRGLPWVGGLAFFLLLTGIVWGLVFAPADYQQGEAFRIIYVHVPSAFLSMALYGLMGFFALLLLVWRIKLAGIMLVSCAPIGASMAFLALVTGSIWGKPMWGTWWIWDARLTSELILLLLYAAIIVSTQAHQNQEQSEKMAAVLTLVGLLDLPVIHYSVYWWNTLHQGATLSVFSRPKIHTSMLYPLLFMCLGLSLYCAALLLAKGRQALLLRERRQSWVRQLVDEEML